MGKKQTKKQQVEQAKSTLGYFFGRKLLMLAVFLACLGLFLLLGKISFESGIVWVHSILMSGILIPVIALAGTYISWRLYESHAKGIKKWDVFLSIGLYAFGYTVLAACANAGGVAFGAGDGASLVFVIFSVLLGVPYAITDIVLAMIMAWIISRKYS